MSNKRPSSTKARRECFDANVVCEVCNSQFRVKPSYKKRGTVRFCSIKCKSAKREPAQTRFWRFVSPCPTSGCWHWMGGTTPFGHGRFRLGGKNDGQIGPHVFSYEMHVTSVPRGLCVLHKCDNPGCVNPSHLFVGDARDNALDAVAKNRMKGLFRPGFDPRRARKAVERK